MPEPDPPAQQDESFDPLQAFIDLFADVEQSDTQSGPKQQLTLEERLQQHIIDGEKEALVDTLDEALEKYAPLEIINDHLLGGMKIVGELFGSGQMQLPFVLQSAEVMKIAVAYLEPRLDRIEGQSRGKIVLATVKGDVHDIGKNLVDIILSNNGYTVHNIGIKKPIGEIIDAWRETKADAIGLSGLLVKSVNVMEDNLRELNELGIDVPVILGGAALTRHYAESHLRSIYNGQCLYGRDAFEGLRVMDHIVEDRISVLSEEAEERLRKRAAVETRTAKDEPEDEPDNTRSDIARDNPVPTPPFWGSRVVESVPLNQVFPFLNTVALFRAQWQFKRAKMSEDEYAAFVSDTVMPILDRLQRQCTAEEILAPAVVYGYYPCASEGNDLVILDPDDHAQELERFTFPRQRRKRRLCIADFFRSVDEVAAEGRPDVLGLSCVTVGPRATEVAQTLFDANDYTEYLYLHGLSVETAEALAELWHKRMRAELGIGASDDPSIRQLFSQHYQGSRYSFGYPACPEMADQQRLFRLLGPERIGCTLTENWQIDPEQSTSAIIVHHPEAKYFAT